MAAMIVGQNKCINNIGLEGFISLLTIVSVKRRR